eukprot:CAMPEP_0198274260 /NCGR_PEP_ID=MMETSP1447-20131203/59671_1 /TAXON_ID=420782 /ORGANISM="Chaetoceros dichaeta, Strain CCMP1751" /LENGTH=722 /DNA_ID=CAMNT_0043968319 /DNA_START=114 /DNA_END=2279 /DNA_ORIENTATION=+
METTTHTTPRNALSLSFTTRHHNNVSNTTAVCTSPAFESAVTAYASRVLSHNSPPEACFDSSVASHVVSTLQSRNPTSEYSHHRDAAQISVQDLEEYPSLMELLEEHCNMSSTVARNALQRIAKAVRTGIFDHDGDSTVQLLQHSSGSSPGGLGGMINLGGSHVGSRMGRYRSKSLGAEHDYGCEDMESIARLGSMLQNSDSGNFTSSLFSLLTSNGEGDRGNVIEEETSFLLEEDELPRTPHKQGIAKHLTPLTSEETSVTEELSTMDIDPMSTKGYSLTPLKPDRLIPVGLLGAIDDLMIPTDNATTSKHSSKFELAPISTFTSPSGRGKKKSKTKSKDLAAALFCARPRSNSLHIEKSPRLQPMSAPLIPYSISQGSSNFTNNFQKQVDSTVQMLMAMNYDICEDSAYEAALVSNADVNVAQHVIDGAVAAPAVCRHMLNDGCYRSDCQFSHDVDGHTCSFWLRGRCGKGNCCKFMHGFSKKLLDGVKVKYLPGQHPSSSPYGGESDLGSKPISIRTSNLVQHNAVTSVSFPNQGGMALFQAASPESKEFSPDRAHSLFNRPSVAPSSSLPTHTFMTNKREPIPFSLDTPNSTQSISPTKVKESAKETPAFSFARIASSGYDKKNSYFDSSSNPSDTVEQHDNNRNSRTVKIPQNLWNSCYNRPTTAFHIQDPIDRYEEVSSSVKREDIVDLHFQSVKSFPIVLSTILPDKLRNHSEVW